MATFETLCPAQSQIVELNFHTYIPHILTFSIFQSFTFLINQLLYNMHIYIYIITLTNLYKHHTISNGFIYITPLTQFPSIFQYSHKQFIHIYITYHLKWLTLISIYNHQDISYSYSFLLLYLAFTIQA